MEEEVRKGRVDGGLAAAEVDLPHAALQQPVDAMLEGRQIRLIPIGWSETEAAVGVAATGNAKTDGTGEGEGGLHFLASARMLQNSNPCSMASSSAT